MPAQPKTPQAPEGTHEGTKDAEVLNGVQATPDNGSPRRARKARADRGPKPEHQFLVSVHAALEAGVDTDKMIQITRFAKRAEGAAAWQMLTHTMDDLTREITGEPEPVEDDEDAEDDESESE
jgi:hypothetical protein